ncbi:hypothetical protein [Azospirillum sp. Sh1]|uniref:hypothetical protein n=1 Tax=Azospirillum sp. Sh1 TaxID=2607285 RepID=UPI0011EC7BBC|nr:hypothetical protein [Azospirillum sp. Sh1]KAA0571077.1 hypothetical protein FZ029_27885 [Azospirillum sp. Sh1]
MTHPRTIIRNAVAAVLTDSPLAEMLVAKRVWTSRAKPLTADTVPAVLVYTPNEKLEKGSYGGDGQGPLIRDLTLVVEIVDLADDDDEATLEDRLDHFAELVEALLDGFVVPGRLADRLRYAGMESDMFERGQHVYGAKIILYTVEYRTATRTASDASLFPSATVPLRLDLVTGRGALPPISAGSNAPGAGIVVVGYDRGIDYDIDTSGPVPVIVRLPSGMIPEGGTVEVSVPLPQPAASPVGVYLGQAPEIGRAHEADYTQVAP